MISGNNTSPEWQAHRTDILVLPVGAMEQHGPHLPLNTDQLIAEYSAKLVAEYLDAALLPGISIATSLEHSGFRGSFSLHPETLMRIIRDIAEEGEHQGFRFLVVINGHGGNFALTPVIRDINRENRKIKILLFASTHGAGRDCLEAVNSGKLDIHAGEAETSIFMAIAGRDCVLPGGTGCRGEFQQKDLNTFGIAHLNENGLAGHPELASREKGEELLADFRKILCQDIEKQIAFLRKKPYYSGPGGMCVRTIEACDLPELIELCKAVHWNQTENDWKLFLEQGTPLSMVHLGSIAGCAAGIGWNKELAWIGLVITRNNMRGLGIASRLVQNLLSRYSGFRTIKLDASAAGKPVYEKIGFAPEGRILRLTAENPSFDRVDAGNLTFGDITEGDLSGLAEKEAVFTGTHRLELFRFYWTNHRDKILGAYRDGKLAGAIFGREGRLNCHAGVLLAESLGMAVSLLREWRRRMASSSFQIDVPEHQSEFLDALFRAGFRVNREFIRMYYGEPCGTPSERSLYAIFGPEVG